jgi:transmembrane sensor
VIVRKSQEHVREEAAAWVARLKDAHTLEDRQAFEDWLAKDSRHRTAYDHALASYGTSSVLRTSKIGRERDLSREFPKWQLTFGRGLAAAALAALLVVGAYQLERQRSLFHPVALESVMLSTGAQARSITLADGSKVSMSPSSEVRIDLNRTRRLAEVRRGRVRLAVTSDDRPFWIIAGRSDAEANSGTFDAAILDGQGIVTRVDHVAVPAAPHAADPGDGNAPLPPGRATLEFNSEPLGEAIGRINQAHSGPRLELDPGLSSRRVTGVFQAGDSRSIAQALAIAFGLQLETMPTGTLLLTKQK